MIINGKYKIYCFGVTRYELDKANISAIFLFFFSVRLIFVTIILFYLLHMLKN